jgi:hypothetical protein
MAETKAWRVVLTCCGRVAGDFYADTWEEANDFRESYTSGPGVNPRGYSGGAESGHQRSGVISQVARTEGR